MGTAALRGAGPLCQAATAAQPVSPSRSRTSQEKRRRSCAAGIRRSRTAFQRTSSWPKSDATRARVERQMLPPVPGEGDAGAVEGSDRLGMAAFGAGAARAVAVDRHRVRPPRRRQETRPRFQETQCYHRRTPARCEGAAELRKSARQVAAVAEDRGGEQVGERFVGLGRLPPGAEHGRVVRTDPSSDPDLHDRLQQSAAGPGKVAKHPFEHREGIIAGAELGGRRAGIICPPWLPIKEARHRLVPERLVRIGDEHREIRLVPRPMPARQGAEVPRGHHLDVARLEVDQP